MLRTNSKKAKENIRQYIMDHADFAGYIEDGEKEPETFVEVATEILNICDAEKFYIAGRYRNDFEKFLDWTQGLPSVLDTCYWYNRSAVEDLAVILEETEDEKPKAKTNNQYLEQEEKAGLLLTRLIYRELAAARV